ncbi:MAG: hypothetical protein RLZZ592_112 [Pseudomonadota bacterium]|jgi:adhesin transport system outer membrane protein
MQRPVLCLALLAGLMALAPGVRAQSAPSSVCDEDSETAAPAARPAVLRDARAVLAALADEAVRRSPEVAGQIAGSRAWRQDRLQVEAGGRPQLGLSGSGVWGGARGGGQSGSSLQQGLGLTLSAPLLDGGRRQAESAYYRGLAEAGELGAEAMREQIALEAIAAALERRRQTLQLRVWDRQVARMACLARQVSEIVALDRGRGSEQVQAAKSLRQAELSRTEVQTQLRQSELRLRSLVGEGGAASVELPPGSLEGLETLPSLAGLIDALPEAAELRQLQRQAEALDRQVEAARAANAPQLSWQIGSSASRRDGSSITAWNAGLTLGLVLADAGAAAASVQAAIERVTAARMQREARFEDRSRQIQVLHDAAQAAQSRQQQIVQLLEESDRLRRATREQWARLGRRSLFDLISAENDHAQLQLARAQAEHEHLMALLQMQAAGAGLRAWLAPFRAEPGPR